MRKNVYKRVEKYFLYFFKASWQKRGFAKMLNSLKRENRFKELARLPFARSLFFNRLLSAVPLPNSRETA